MPSRNEIRKKKIRVTMARNRILGNTFFMEARVSTRKKDSSQPSMIAMLVNSGSSYVAEKKKTRARRPMNGNASTVEPPGKNASNEVKAGEASFKIYS